jgi:protease-4
MRRKILILTMGIILIGQSLYAQNFASYYSRNIFLRGTAGSYQIGLNGYANPANPKMQKSLNLQYYWASTNTNNYDVNDWGLFTSFRGLGFNVLRQQATGKSVRDYNLNLSVGDYGASFGIGYTWSKGDITEFNRKKLLTLGMIFRPNRYLSISTVGNVSVESSALEGVVDAGLRPFGNSRITLFGDFAIQRKQKLKDMPWSTGASIEAVYGLSLVGRYFHDDIFTVGLTVNLGNFSFTGQSHFNSEQNRAFNTYGIRLGEFQPTFISAIGSNNYYFPMELKGKVAYQKFWLFDHDTHRFMDILNRLRYAAEDSRVKVIAINLSSIKIQPELAWEIRNELKKAKKSGKKIVAFIDNAGMTEYHIASVADVIMLDPEGMLFLEGYLLGRTFLRGTLDKMGLGIDEWRFFKYKSAAEALSRTSYSKADKEQRQAYVDDWYELARTETSEERKFSSEKFDEIVNEKVVLLPQDAIKEGFADTLCRWRDVDKIIKELDGRKKWKLEKNSLEAYATANSNWGKLPEVAVVYGAGVCAMDAGINARNLEKVFHHLQSDDNVKAVVFRVDSPGGYGMASDVVAAALRKCAKKKPVIVSQGQVAGSGGYWISMYGDTIVAGPNTITGSIGVIGLWIYDKGFSDKLGMTSDFVKRGDHADLGFGIRLPLLGLQVPARNLTDEERSKMELIIKRFYNNFVEKVAGGRNMDIQEVEKIAQGRIYSGIDGKENGLVDEIGGLNDAIYIARTAAKIHPNQKINLTEIPKDYGFWGFPNYVKASINKNSGEDPVIKFIEMVVAKPGYPLYLMELGTYPVEE